MARGKGRRRQQGNPAGRSGGKQVTRPNQPGQVVQQTVAFEIEGYRGPVPPPEVIEGYQTAIPNGGERVMALAEREASHRHDMDRKQLRASLTVHLVGQILSFTLAGGVVALGAWLLHDGKDLAGYTALLVGAGSLIAAVVRGIRQPKNPEE